MKMEPIDVITGTALEAHNPLHPSLNDPFCRPAMHEARTFDLPSSIWAVMLASYAIFFCVLMLALGGEAKALFMLVISIGYTAMYFGTAYALNRIDAASRTERPSLVIQTSTGPLGYGAAFGQILVVPIVVAGFGIGIAVISMLTAR